MCRENTNMNTPDEIESIKRSFSIALANYRKDHPEKLKDARLTLEWKGQLGIQKNVLDYYIRLHWTGYSENLEIEPQREGMYCHEDEVVGKVYSLLKRMGTREDRRKKLAEKGLRFDGPLRAFLEETGRTKKELIDAALDHKIIGNQKDSAISKTMEFAGRNISLSITDGKVQSKISLNENVHWSKGCLTARGVEIPDAVMTALKGKPLRSVLDHPWLDNLVITSVSMSKDKKNESCTTFMTREC